MVKARSAIQRMKNSKVYSNLRILPMFKDYLEGFEKNVRGAWLLCFGFFVHVLLCKWQVFSPFESAVQWLMWLAILSLVAFILDILLVTLSPFTAWINAGAYLRFDWHTIFYIFN
jgi:hypothetical protein